MCPGLDELSTGLKRIQKAGASGGDVKSPRVLAAEFVLHHAGCGGKEHVGSHRPNHYAFDIIGCNSATLQRLARRMASEIRGSRSLIGDMALLDAGAFSDPLITSVDHLFQILIGKQAGWNIGPEGAYFRPDKAVQIKSPNAAPEMPTVVAGKT